MNNIKMLFASLLVTSTFLQAADSLSAEPDPGRIVFYIDGNVVCTLKVEPGRTNLYKKEKGCRSGGIAQQGAIGFENVRSAVTIQLSTNMGGNKDDHISENSSEQPDDDTGCNDKRGFDYIIKTTKNNLTTTEPLSMAQLRVGNIDMPVMPGILVVSIYEEKGKPPTYPTPRCLNIYVD